MLEDLILQIQPKYLQKNIILTFTESIEVDVIADPVKIRQVFLNLLMNAYEFTAENGKVEILLTKDKKNAIVHVKDNGIGIDPEALLNIFERFYRAEPSRNRDTGGAGLGLSIVQSIVKAHNGSIHVESEKDKGTQFVVYLPLCGCETPLQIQ